MAITSTVPILGKTVDDDRAKPAIFKRYDYGYGYLLLLVRFCGVISLIVKFGIQTQGFVYLFKNVL